MHALRTLGGSITGLIACLLVPLAVLATWSADHVADTDGWVETVEPVAGDRVVRAAVGERLSALVERSVSLDRAPSSLREGGSQLIDDAVEQVLASEAFTQAWVAANRAAHAELIAVLEGRSGSAELEGGHVVLRLDTLLAAVVDELGGTRLAPFVGTLAPSESLSFAVAPADELSDAQTAYELLQAVEPWLPWVFVAMLVLTLVLLPGRRLAAAGLVALGSAVACVLMLTAVVWGGSVLGDRFTQGNREVAGALVEIVARDLRTTTLWVVVAAVVIGVALLVLHRLVAWRHERRADLRDDGYGYGHGAG